MDELRMAWEEFDKIDASNLFSNVEPEDIHGKVLVGSYIRGTSALTYASGLDGITFLKYPPQYIHQYLLENCIFKVRRRSFASFRIVKVIVSKNGDYGIIDKTYWLRLIQRCWKSRLAQYKADINTLRRKYLYHRELHGNHYPGSARIKGKKMMGLLASASAC